MNVDQSHLFVTGLCALQPVTESLKMKHNMEESQIHIRTVCGSSALSHSEQAGLVKTRVHHQNMTVHDEGLKRLLEGKGRRTHIALVVEV